jgi:SAM-dependent methyltransferase
MLVHREVFEKLTKPYFMWTLDKEPKPVGCSEDFWFLRKVRKELGIRPVVDPNVQCQHVGYFGSGINGLIPVGDSVAVKDRFDWIRSKAFGSIIDIGSNEGKTFKGRENVTHVDLDTYDIPNFIQADASKIPVTDKSHDCAVLGEILEHVPDVNAVLKEAKRIARHKVFITTPNEYEWDDRHLPSHKFPKEKIAEMRGKTMKELATEACKITGAVATVDEETNPHLYHVRQFTEITLREEIAKVFPHFKLEMLRYDGWSFFAIEADASK